jgi:cysteine desulfurase
MSLYMDYNASTPCDSRVVDEMVRVYREYFGNADSRTHEHGIAARSVVEEARGKLAALLSVEPNEIIFTSGATESDNMAILGLEEYGVEKGKKHIVSTAIEHKAVIEPLKHLAERGFEVDFVNPDESGRVSAEVVLSKVRSDTLLVSVMSANNETGVIQPTAKIGETLHGKDVYFHIDAAQSCGKLVEELQNTKYDMMSVTAHKMYGAQGIGALILRNRKYRKPPLKPLVFGGGHENGYRSGTLPVALIAGFGKAAEIALAGYKSNMEHYAEIKGEILKLLAESGVKYTINGTQDYCMSNTLNVSFLGVDSEALMLATKQYCSLSNGSACTSHDYSHSHVLTAMGLPDERIESAIRMSWGKESDNASILSLINRLIIL